MLPHGVRIILIDSFDNSNYNFIRKKHRRFGATHIILSVIQGNFSIDFNCVYKHSRSRLCAVFLNFEPKRKFRTEFLVKMSDFEENDDFMCDDEEDYGLVSSIFIIKSDIKTRTEETFMNIQFRILQEYSEDSNSEPDVDLENQYYNSKALKEDEPLAALQSFQKVLDLENGDKGEWGFKALKQMIKINFKLSNYNEMMTRYKQLLTYIKSAVTRNHSEKSINSILDYISTSKNVKMRNMLLFYFYAGASCLIRISFVYV